jgi:hypothetical protein
MFGDASPPGDFDLIHVFRNQTESETLPNIKEK